MAAGKTTVVNLRFDAYDQYIGRSRATGDDDDGYFGNPFVMRRPTAAERVRVITEFETYFWNRMRTDSKFAERVLALRGKRLGCFCKPLACHGDVIATWLDAQPEPK